MNDRVGQDRDPTGSEAAGAAAAGGLGAGSVGELLRAERLRRGWTLADAEIYLKIRRVMLEAIEQGRFELLPGRAYALAFARTYAEFLGLDAEEIVARARDELRNVAEPEAAAAPRGGLLGDLDLGRIGMAAAAAVGVIIAGLWMFGGSDGGVRRDGQGGQVAAVQREAPDPGRPAAPVATVPSGPGIAAAMPPPPPPAAPAQPARPAPGGSTDPTSAQASTFTPADAAPAAQAQSQALAAAGRGAPPPAQPPQSRIQLKANGDTWVEIRDQAGASVLARTLRNGEVYNVPDRPGLVLTSGRIATIEVRVDGQVVAPARPARREMSLDPARLLQNAQAPGAEPPAQPRGQARRGTAPPAAAPPAGN